MLHIEADV